MEDDAAAPAVRVLHQHRRVGVDLQVGAEVGEGIDVGKGQHLRHGETGEAQVNGGD